ncbi:hypothetical protein [Bradyrhizobium sp. F1.13.3]|uniref:hypothetical protein n=1 Tax=Bradyrhizobium sp. F1.13.3 TaxID=3156351 RepID=UPI003390BFF3
MSNDQTAKERDQLLNHWRTAIAKRRDWTTFHQIESIHSILSGAPSPRRSKFPIRDLLREFHNQLGYKALNGGLCAGAILRTQSFMDTNPRIGSKLGQTVHIEHTVPVCVLESEIKKRKFSDSTEALAWYLAGVRDSTDALNPVSDEWDKPFMRYKTLFSDGGIVWNVFDGEQVEPTRFTFDDHVDIVARLLRHVGAEDSLVGILAHQTV